MNTWILNSIWLWSNFISWIREFFEGLGHYRLLWWIIYILFIISLYIRLYYSNKTFQKINTLFRVSMDTLYYESSLLLYTHHKDIYQFEENIPLLLQHKTNLIQKKDKAYYYEDFYKLIEEIEYIYQLTEPGKIINNKNDIISQYNIVITLTSTIKNIKNILTILTLGIYKILS